MNTVLHTLLAPARTLLAVLHTAGCSALGIVGMAVFRRSGDWVMWRVGRRLWSIPLMRHVVGTEVHVEVHPDTLALARQKRGLVLLGNHQSLLDINAAFVACPTPIVFLSKASIRKVPLLGKINEMAGTVFVERGNRSSSEQAVKQLVHTLSLGRSVLVFPEGTRSATGDLQPFKKGAFHLALQAQAPMVPMWISGTHALLPPSAWLLRRATTSVTVTLGAPRFCEDGDTATSLRDWGHQAVSDLSRNAVSSPSRMAR